MAKKDPWKDWGKGIAGLIASGQTFRPGAPGNVAAQNAPQAAWPDPGTYDPTFDINRENALLGHFRYGQDFARDWGELGAGATGGRMGADLQSALARYGTETQWGRDDQQRGFTRSIADLISAEKRGTEDYQRNIAGLQRSYDRLAGNQAQAQRAAGVAQGGAAVQAAQKRKANQAWDRAPIDTGYKRFVADNLQTRNRIGEDNHLAMARMNQQADWGVQGINQQYTRGREDALTDYGRTGTDLQNYLGGQARLAYYTSGQIQPPGISILDLLKRKGMSP